MQKWTANFSKQQTSLNAIIIREFGGKRGVVQKFNGFPVEYQASTLMDNLTFKVDKLQD